MSGLKLNRILGSVVIFFGDCSVFLLRKFGKITLCSVVGIEKKIRGFGNVSPAGSVGVRRAPPATNAPTSKICPASRRAQTGRFTERVPFSYAC